MTQNPFRALQSSDDEEYSIESNEIPNNDLISLQDAQTHNDEVVEDIIPQTTEKNPKSASTENSEELKEEIKQTDDNEDKGENDHNTKNLDPDHPTPEQIKNCPTLFQALGFDENRKVLYTFLGISVLLVVTGFGSFYLGKLYIPKFFPSIDPFDAPIYSCGLAVVLTQIIVFTFYFWAWGHDVAEEKKEKELEELAKKAAQSKTKKAE